MTIRTVKFSTKKKASDPIGCIEKKKKIGVVLDQLKYCLKAVHVYLQKNGARQKWVKHEIL